MEDKAINDGLVAYVKRLEQRTGQRWAITELYYTGSYHRAVIVSETGEAAKRCLWFDYGGFRWRWDGCNSGWAGWKARKAAVQGAQS